jgi:hypothetical protein
MVKWPDAAPDHSRLGKLPTQDGHNSIRLVVTDEICWCPLPKSSFSKQRLTIEAQLECVEAGKDFAS